MSERAIALAYGLERELRPRCARRVGAAAAVPRRVLETPARARALGKPRLHGTCTACSGFPKRWRRRSRGGVELGHAVVAIELEAERATVTCANGRRLRARHVVAAVPPSVLRAHRDRAEAPARAGRSGRDVAVATVDAGLSRAAQPFLGAGRLCAEPVHRHARRHARGRAQSRRSDRGHEPHGVDYRRQRRGTRSPGVPAEAGRAVIAAIETLRPAAGNQLELIGLHSWGADRSRRRRLGVFSARRGDAVRRGAREPARPAAFLRRAPRD